MNMMDNPRFNHRVEIVEGVMREQCAGIMTGFFRGLRGMA
jgi:tRNA(adenine34) deaminase